MPSGPTSKLAAIARPAKARRNGSSGWSPIWRSSRANRPLRLIQRRLTSIDLDLDDKVKAQYQLLRVLSWSFSEGHELAKGLEEEYEPIWDKSHWADLRGEVERKHRPQHLPLGNIAKPVEALIVEGAAGAPARILSYGEFVRDPDRGRAKADDLESYLEPRDDIAEQCRWRDDQPTEERGGHSMPPTPCCRPNWRACATRCHGSE